MSPTNDDTKAGEVGERDDVYDWEVVWQAPNYALGGMIKSLLASEGVLVMMRSLLGIPHLGFSGPVEVLVPAEMADDARALIGAFMGQGGAELADEPEDPSYDDPEEDPGDEPDDDDRDDDPQAGQEQSKGSPRER